MPHLLLLETDLEFITAFLALARQLGFSAITAKSMQDALIRYHQKVPDAIVLGPGAGPLEERELKEKIGDAAPAIYTVAPPGESAAQAQTQLRELLERLRAQHRVGHPCSSDCSPNAACDFAEFIGRSPAMQKLYNEIRKVARTDLPVLLIGESGTGKELAARAIHRCSTRSEHAYVPINCSAISGQLIESELFGHEKGSFTGADRQRQGYFEQANNGTLFLDEVTEMPVEAQTKLLRALENGEYMKVGGSELHKCNTRIIAATNRSPSRAIKDNKLREDLYYRLGVFPIKIPPLRDRGEDAILIARHLVDELNKEHGHHRELSVACLEKIAHYRWPGNIRELRNAVLRSYIMSNTDQIDINLEPGRID